MKNLDLLIRINKNRLNELRQIIIGLQNKKHDHQHQIITLKNEMNVERQISELQSDLFAIFANYAQRNLEMQTKLDKEIKILDKQILSYQEEIIDAFIEVKKMEIYKEMVIAKMKHEENQKENRRLDEISTNIFLKHKNGNY